MKIVDKWYVNNFLIIIYEKIVLNWVKKVKVKGGIGILFFFDMMCVNRYLFVFVDNVIFDNLENILKMWIEFYVKFLIGFDSKDYVCLLFFVVFFGGKVLLEDFRKKECSKRKEDVYVDICSKKGCKIRLENDIGELLRLDELSGYFYFLRDFYIFYYKFLILLFLLMIVKENEILVLKNVEFDVFFKVF